jgi:hypothetical protein
MPHLRQVIAENPLVQVTEAVPEQEPAVRRGRVMSQDRQQRAELLIAHLATAAVGFGVRVRPLPDGLRFHHGVHDPPVALGDLPPGEALLPGAAAALPVAITDPRNLATAASTSASWAGCSMVVSRR